MWKSTCHTLLKSSKDSGLVRDGIYKRMEFAVENVFDICAIINTYLALGVPGEDEDILEHYTTNAVISDAMRRKIQGMWGFQNIVVHRYGTIDDALAFRLLTENIGDFSEFLDEAENILKKNTGDGFRIYFFRSAAQNGSRTVMPGISRKCASSVRIVRTEFSSMVATMRASQKWSRYSSRISWAR